MKRRFRYYARSGWEVVEVSRANLYKVFQEEDWGDEHHYKEIRTWCNDTFPKDSWEGTFQPYGSDTKGTKRFVFKHPKHATLFKLKWLG